MGCILALENILSRLPYAIFQDDKLKIGIPLILPLVLMTSWAIAFVLRRRGVALTLATMIAGLSLFAGFNETISDVIRVCIPGGFVFLSATAMILRIEAR